ncbi:CHRD domain-containing protein [Dictyobacter arantiisoli]|uniref:CHRD domain-containing protein n=1 Tax=Dictyobacter arantiisoli TaxID=2014874 RepID=A0A5A5TBA0_9CHLR|nr:CHRD domain-containing protein [Dictyobacter arantiisoli]GCF08194.1 hypothetical protein KDI_17580 [Dictyobacter arantiisoli]
MRKFLKKIALMGMLFTTALTVWTTPSLAVMHTANDQQGLVNLQHTPNGTVTFTRDLISNSVIVLINLQGLQPYTIHPAGIARASCETGNNDTPQAIYQRLSTIVADKAGHGISRTVIYGSSIEDVRGNTHSVNVYSDATFPSPIATIAVTCGNIGMTNQQGTMLNYIAPLGNTLDANQNVSGTAELFLHKKTLTVEVHLTGLVPGSVHMNHIHAGSTEKSLSGAVLYDLTPLVADATGTADALTILHHVSAIPSHGWFINVHFGTDLTTQVDYDVIASGDIVTTTGSYGTIF